MFVKPCWKDDWEKFLASKDTNCNITIYCETKEEAEKLLKYLDSKGFDRNKEEYTTWDICEGKTCCTNEMNFISVDFSSYDSYKYVPFRDIEEYIDKENTVDIKEYFELKRRITNKCEIRCTSCPLADIHMSCSELEINHPYEAYKLLKKAEEEEKELELRRTWHKFLSNKGKESFISEEEGSAIAIHCNTEEKANKLLKYLHKKGFRWSSGKSLLSHNNYITYLDDTCYSAKVRYGEFVSWFEEGYTILQFNEIEKYIDKEEFYKGEMKKIKGGR